MQCVYRPQLPISPVIHCFLLTSSALGPTFIQLEEHLLQALQNTLPQSAELESSGLCSVVLIPLLLAPLFQSLYFLTRTSCEIHLIFLSILKKKKKKDFQKPTPLILERQGAPLLQGWTPHSSSHGWQPTAPLGLLPPGGSVSEPAQHKTCFLMLMAITRPRRAKLRQAPQLAHLVSIDGTRVLCI